MNVYLNGVLMHNGFDYKVVEGEVAWTGDAFRLDPADQIEVVYAEPEPSVVDQLAEVARRHDADDA